MHFEAGAASDTGQLRTHNEDAFVCNTRLGLFAVCDGMGGESAGEVASNLAVETMLTKLTSDEEDTSEDLRGFLPSTRRLESAVLLCNQVVYEESQANSQRKGMGTTVVTAWVEDYIACLGHVGDSRAYLWRNDHLEQLTSDHSLVQEKVRAGLLTPEEGLNSSEQNIVTRALGRKAEVEVDLAEVPLMAGDYLLLCSDGVTGMVSDSIMADTIVTLQEPQEICDQLVDLANRNGGVDNITVVLVRVLNDRLWRRLWRSLWSR